MSGSVKGWFLWQEPAGAYEIGTDETVVKTGKRSGYVRQRSPLSQALQFGAILQKINAELYKGKRMQFSALLKCDSVQEHCGLFMEVFDTKPIPESSLQCVDYMQNRSVSGTQDWAPYRIVLDVPQNAFGINIGARLVGSGKLWIDGVTFEEVGKEVPVTDEMSSFSMRKSYPNSPRNLDFDEA